MAILGEFLFPEGLPGGGFETDHPAPIGADHDLTGLGGWRRHISSKILANPGEMGVGHTTGAAAADRRDRAAPSIRGDDQLTDRDG